MRLDPARDAEQAYEAAVERAEAIRAAWAELGSPLLAAGSRQQPVPHPLLKAISGTESLAHRLRRSVLHRHRGPDPSAVLGPPSPASDLRLRVRKL